MDTRKEQPRPKYKTAILYGLFWLILAAMFLPFAQQLFQFTELEKLDGAVTATEEPKISWEAWFNDSLQSGTEAWLNEQFGYRNFLLRANNQIAFDLFRMARAKDVIIGKDDYLYEESYIRSYYGKDFVGEEKLEKMVRDMKELQDSLAGRSVEMLFLICPGKGFFFPEYIPDHYSRWEKGPTNYGTITEKLKGSGVNYLDFNAWFMAMKDTASHPLYPRTGIHWTGWGTYLVSDSLTKYFEGKMEIDMTDLVVERVTIGDTVSPTDRDISMGMNLLFPFPEEELCYPYWSYVDSCKTLPDLMTVGDSYWWTIFGSGIAGRLFDRNQFWYYNMEVHDPKWPAPRSAEAVDLTKELLSKDVLLILMTEANLRKTGWGFIRIARNLLRSTTVDDAARIAKYAEIEANIRRDSVWLASIAKKAEEKGISQDSMITIDVEYMYRLELIQQDPDQ